MISGNKIVFDKYSFNPESQFETEALTSGDTNIRPYVSAEDKFMLQQEIGTRIRPFLFLHAEDLEEERSKVLDLSPDIFYDQLRSSWDWHLSACANIDHYLSRRSPGNLDSPSLSDWQDIKELLNDAFDSDTAKSVYSSAIKSYVQSNIEKFIDSHPEITDEERLLLYTPSSEVFYTKYIFDHSELGTELTNEERHNLETELAEKYHHGDLDLLKIRANNITYLGQRYDDILSFQVKYVQKTNKTQRSKNELIEKYPELEPLDKILAYDNWDEYLYVCQQLPFSDIHMRDYTVNKLANLGLTDVDRDSLSYSKDELITLVDQAVHAVSKKYVIPLRNYLQTTTSCGVSSVLTIAREKGAPANRDTEINWWHKSGAPYNFPGGMGLILRSLGFETTFVTNNDHHFEEGQHPVKDYENNQDTKAVVSQYIDLHDSAIKSGMQVVKDDLSYDDIVKSLANSWIPIIGMKMPETDYILHWVIANGYTDEYLHITDSLGRFEKMNEANFNRWTSTYMGRRFIMIKR